MKKTLFTLAISILCLGAASLLFSLDNKKVEPLVESSTSHIAQLPAPRETFLTASLGSQTSLNPNFIPIRNWSIKDPDIEARAAAVFDLNGNKFLYSKNIKEKLPIASLTKILTAIVVLENLSLDDVVTISKKAVMTEGENGRLVIGEKLTVRDLLYIMLIESSNDSAVALAGVIDKPIDLMNQKAKELGLKDTYFVDPTGISKWNHSTAFDLAHLIKYSFSKPLIWQILGIEEIEISNHYLVNTNKLLGEIPEIIGGKTGYTEEAGGCMLTMIKVSDKPGEYLITIILGSNNRELETTKLVNWINKAYVW